MMSATTAKLAAGVAGGYVLGRTKKFRLAVILAGLIAGKRLAGDPKALAKKIVDERPELGHLRGQLTEGLGGAAKELALATAAARLESVTESLQNPASAAGDAAGGAAKKAAAPAKKSTAKKSTATKSTAKKSTAKKAPAKKAPAKKSGSSSSRTGPAKKSSSSRSRSGSAKKSTAASKG